MKKTITSSVYGMAFIYGRAAFSACSPIFAVFARMAREKDNGAEPEITVNMRG